MSITTPQQHTVRRATIWRLIIRIVLFIVVFALVVAGFMLLKVGRTFSLINTTMFSRVFHIQTDDTYHEENRINILLIGLRGDGDTAHGEYLSDTMMVLSIKTDQNRAALISIPRDLYVRIPGYNRMEKINFAYAYGMQTNHNGMDISRLAVERVAGIPIDHVVVVNFASFEKLIDAVGGVDVYVPNDFKESSQWGMEFYVPKGMNHMNGQTALYYSRSRYSTSDFDRARRQQDVLMALGEKALHLGIITNPITFNTMLNTLSEGITTDIDFITMLHLSRYVDVLKKDAGIRRFVFDDSPDGMLVSGNANGAYILTPKEGMENYTAMKEKFRTIFTTTQ